MKEEILRQQKMLSDIQSQLTNIRKFLIGDLAEEKCENQKEECFLDTIRNNNYTIDMIKGNINTIEEVIMGGKN